MAPKKLIGDIQTPEKKVGYSATANPQTLEDMKAKAHDLRIPFTKLLEGLMDNYLKTGKGYTPDKK
jgi:hypothetical protein